MDIFSKVRFYQKDRTFLFKNETQHHSSHFHGWPYSTPFDERNFLVHLQLFGQKVNKENKQDWRIWASENPNVLIEKSVHPQQVTVWCAFWYGVIVGSFFFENEQGVAVTIDSERYHAMLNEFLFPIIEEVDMDDIWIQQDGAIFHTANVTIDILRTVFENRIISRYSDVNWPPWSCDLTPLDCFLWGSRLG